MQFGCGALSLSFCEKANFSLQQKGLACNYYKVFVVNEMVPPTSVSYPKSLLTQQLINYDWC
jgi:hypothetical protein